MTINCFICQNEINGDSQYYQHHLNQCLDQQVITTISNSTSRIRREKTPSSLAASSASGSKSNYTDLKETGQWSGGIAPVTSRARERQYDQERLEADAAFAMALSNELNQNQNDKASASLARDLASKQRRESWDVTEWEDIIETEGSAAESIANEVKLLTKRSNITLGVGSAKSKVEGTANLIPLLSMLLTRSHKEGKTRVAYLCSERVEHVGTGRGDLMWGCGYRNAQMIFSSLRHMPCYRHSFHVQDGGLNNEGVAPIPTIAEFQAIIEDAWKNGYDPPAAEHFGSKLRGRTKWIGTTEVYTAMTMLGINTRIYDFPKVPGSDGTHSLLVKWIRDYFSESSTHVPHKRSSPDSVDGNEDVRDAFTELNKSQGVPVKITNKQPLYLQHDGHSRTVIGLDSGKGGDWLLVYDPAKSVPTQLKKSATLHASTSSGSGASVSVERARLSAEAAFWAAAPGRAQIWNADSDSIPAGDAGFGLDLKQYSRLLEGYRVSLTSLRKKSEYQILVGLDSPLTVEQKVERRIVRSTRVTL